MSPETLFKALSDPTRLRCIVLLAGQDELCVCALTQALGLPQPKISHHLGTLRKAGLVSDRKEGLWIHYRINPELPEWVGRILQLTVSGVQAKAPYSTDASALAGMTNRPGSICSA